MANVGSILSAAATLIVSVGAVVVLFKAGGLIDALATAIGPPEKDKP